MNAPHSEPTVSPDPEAQLERTLIDEFLYALGINHDCLHEMPADIVKEIMTLASEYASCRLTEIEARAGLVKGLHGLVKSG